MSALDMIFQLFRELNISIRSMDSPRRNNEFRNQAMEPPSHNFEFMNYHEGTLDRIIIPSFDIFLDMSAPPDYSFYLLLKELFNQIKTRSTIHTPDFEDNIQVLNSILYTYYRNTPIPPSTFIIPTQVYPFIYESNFFKSFPFNIIYKSVGEYYLWGNDSIEFLMTMPEFKTYNGRNLCRFTGGFYIRKEQVICTPLNKLCYKSTYIEKHMERLLNENKFPEVRITPTGHSILL